MYIKQKLTSIKHKIIKLPLRVKIPVAFLICALFGVMIWYFQIKEVEFSYSGNTCIFDPTFFPDVHKATKNEYYEFEKTDYIQVANIKLFSRNTCFSAKKSPKTGSEYLSISMFGNDLFHNKYKLTVLDPPKFQSKSLSDVISVKKILELKLDAVDRIFDYQLEIGVEKIICPVANQTINCDIRSMKLTQGKEYDLKLIRKYKNQTVAVLIQKKIDTLDPTSIVDSSIISGQIIYDNPKVFTIDFDKEITSSDVVIEKVSPDGRLEIDAKTSILDRRLTLSLSNDLVRDSNYEITINQVEASDLSTIEGPYKISFKVSDGPSVALINVDSFSAPISKIIAITFDQTILSSQSVDDYVNVSGVSAVISRSDNQVFISYTNAPICTDIKITISAGLISANNVTQNDSWSFNTRTICHTVSSIGRSQDGRQIMAYTFGYGEQSMLFVGSIHGNEVSSKYLMNDLIDELEINAHNIPANKKIIVIPTINPDGLAAYRRNNSNNVDLNRNFPTIDWQTDTYSVTNQLVPGGGGSVPLSEPESQAIADYTSGTRPRLIVSFHSSAGYAIANQAADSINLAAIYSRLSGYRNMTGIEGGFSYPITGTYDDWVREQLDIASVIVELSSNTNSEFWKNKSALWAMIKS